MKKILFSVFILITFAFTSDIPNNTSVLITRDSQLFIKVETNINKLTCEFNILKLKNPVPVYFQKIDDKIIFDNTNLILENNCFDCGGKQINNDFRELLKSELYPQTHIILKEISNIPNNKNQTVAGLDICIAGVSRSYKLPVVLKGNETLQIEGVLKLDICEYNLDPPKKALGLIVVKDIIEINFHLVVKEY